MTVTEYLSPAQFKKISTFIYQRTGISLGEEKVALLSNRLRKRVRALNLETYDEYYELLRSGDDEEMTHFLSAVTTNETYFFRNEKLWECVANQLIPSLLEASPTARLPDLTFWSAASSTGAEAYTLAILLRERIPPQPARKITIIGSDISEKVLNIARAARYDNYAVSKMTPARIKAAFRMLDDGQTYELRDQVRQMVKFEFHNLRDPHPRGRFDVVFVRNVMMYFDLPMKRLVLKNVTNAIRPGGYLVIGDVDPLRDGSGLRDDCTLEYIRPSIYRKPMK